MIKQAILATVLIGIGCICLFVGCDEPRKMAQDILSEEPVEESIAQGIDTEGTLIYWTDWWGNEGSHKIRRLGASGLDVEDLVTGLSHPIGIALDVSGDQMYWTGAGKIHRANLDGSNVEELVPDVRSTIESIALDISGNKMYWTVWGDVNKIQRANLDGSNVEDLVTDVASLRGIALDISNGKMYWSDYGTGKIQRANLDGSGVEDLVTGLETPNGIALDLDGNKIYWVDEEATKVQCANLDGSNLNDLIVGLGGWTIGIALDISGEKIYWTNSDRMQRANLDGSGVEVVVPESAPFGIALLSSP